MSRTYRRMKGGRYITESKNRKFHGLKCRCTWCVVGRTKYLNGKLPMFTYFEKLDDSLE